MHQHPAPLHALDDLTGFPIEVLVGPITDAHTVGMHPLSDEIRVRLGRLSSTPYLLSTHRCLSPFLCLSLTFALLALDGSGTPLFDLVGRELLAWSLLLPAVLASHEEQGAFGDPAVGLDRLPERAEVRRVVVGSESRPVVNDLEFEACGLGRGADPEPFLADGGHRDRQESTGGSG